MTNVDPLYTKHLGRSHFAGKIRNWMLDNAIHRRSENHIADKIPQLAIFAFDHIGHKINIEGIYERDELELFFEWLMRHFPKILDKTAIDIGANIGNHSLFMSKFFNKIVSFEPNPKTFALLQFNASLVDGVTCHPVGLSDSPGTLNFNVSKNNIGGSHIADAASDDTVPIQVTSLDLLAETLGPVGLIKIDVEGHEYQAINGARAVITANTPFILFEQHESDFVNGTSRVINLLRELGYSQFAVIKPYPRQDKWRTRRLAGIYAMLGRAIFGQSLKLTVVDQFTPGFYSFIVAIPPA